MEGKSERCDALTCVQTKQLWSLKGSFDAEQAYWARPKACLKARADTCQVLFDKQKKITVSSGSSGLEIFSLHPTRPIEFSDAHVVLLANVWRFQLLLPSRFIFFSFAPKCSRVNVAEHVVCLSTCATKFDSTSTLWEYIETCAEWTQLRHPFSDWFEWKQLKSSWDIHFQISLCECSWEIQFQFSCGVRISVSSICATDLQADSWWLDDLFCKQQHIRKDKDKWDRTDLSEMEGKSERCDALTCVQTKQLWSLKGSFDAEQDWSFWRFVFLRDVKKTIRFLFRLRLCRQKTQISFVLLPFKQRNLWFPLNFCKA